MSVETQEQKEAGSPFGSKKITQAECAMYVQQAIMASHRPITNQLKIVTNALETLMAFLAEVGVGGTKITQEEIIAFVKSKNAQTAGAPPANGTQA